MAQAKLLGNRPAPVSALFTIAPRLDLRTGALAAGVLDLEAAFLSEEWTLAMGDARRAWSAAGHAAPLSVRAPSDCLLDSAGASLLDEALRRAGFPMRSVTLEAREGALLERDGLVAVERLRARGWGVMLRSDADCPLALGGRVRSLFTDILAAAPSDLTPFLGLDGYDDAPLARRIRAASNAGLNVTADDLRTPAFAGLLIAAGFDRGQGPGLRSRLTA